MHNMRNFVRAAVLTVAAAAAVGFGAAPAQAEPSGGGWYLRGEYAWVPVFKTCDEDKAAWENFGWQARCERASWSSPQFKTDLWVRKGDGRGGWQVPPNQL